jgi:hypothetical protein
MASKLTKVAKREILRNELLDAAAELAKIDPQCGVDSVVRILDVATAADDRTEVKNIMDGATARGFECEFWPGNGGMGIRVRYIPKKEG